MPLIWLPPRSNCRSPPGVTRKITPVIRRGGGDLRPVQRQLARGSSDLWHFWVEWWHSLWRLGADDEKTWIYGGYVYIHPCMHPSVHPSMHACMHTYITLHCITLQYITLHHVTSHHITSHHVTSHPWHTSMLSMTYMTYITYIRYITYITYMTYDLWHATCDIWHMTYDNIWSMVYDTWSMKWIMYKWYIYIWYIYIYMYIYIYIQHEVNEHTLRSSSVACWTIPHLVCWFSYLDLHFSSGISSCHLWLPEKLFHLER